ncbi:MAG: hypothetical protein LC670_12470 [Flavobacteriales bacterium]|nr:hypothetical protein [Flavobacteriales bacterium]
MKKPDNRKGKVPTPFNDEDYGKRPRKALKTSKPPKRIRLQDLDFDDEE